MEEKYKFLSDSKKSKFFTPIGLKKYKNPMKLSPISTTNVYVTSEDKNRIAGNPLLFTPTVSPSEFDLSLALSRLNSCYEQVTDLIPRIVYFDDRPSGGTTPYTNINDGCSDMYDTANAYNTNLTQLYVDAKEDNVSFEDSIPYTHTQATEGDCDYADPPMDGTILDGSNYFGESSEYFTNMYPGMFAIAASNVNITEYSITGNIGSDGDGIDIVYIETAHPGWTAFIKTNYDDAQEDPSINHIILVYGDVSEVTQLYDDTGEYDDHCLQNLGPQNSSIITVVVATESDSPALTSEEAVAIANKILDVCLTGC